MQEPMGRMVSNALSQLKTQPLWLFLNAMDTAGENPASLIMNLLGVTKKDLNLSAGNLSPANCSSKY